MYKDIRGTEFFKREGQWYATISYATPIPRIATEIAGTLGVDFNAVGNVAVMADLQSGHVRRMGFDPFRTKHAFRRRIKNLQRTKKVVVRRAIKRKQSRRTKYENHVVSKTIANYAKEHRLAVLVEDLSGVSSGRIKRFSKRSNWAFAQLLDLLKYKCALLGVPLLEVCPAYTSKQCSRCGSICEPDGKRFECSTCGHNDHRDANAAFNIAARAWPLHCVPTGGSGNGLSAPLSGFIGAALEGSRATA